MFCPDRSSMPRASAGAGADRLTAWNRRRAVNGAARAIAPAARPVLFLLADARGTIRVASP